MDYEAANQSTSVYQESHPDTMDGARQCVDVNLGLDNPIVNSGESGITQGTQDVTNINESYPSSMKRPHEQDEEGYEPQEAIGCKKAKFVSSIPTYMRILMASKDAGPIIGKSGTNIKKLRESYNASVLLPDCPGPERVMIIATSLANACSILIDVMSFMDMSDKETSMKFLVHQSQAGAVIGKNGANIKEFRETCGAMIKVYTECAPGSSERVVEVRGQPEIIASTIYTIVEFLQTAPPIGPVYPYDPVNHNDSYASEYGGFTMYDNKPGFSRGSPGGPFRHPRGGRTRMGRGRFGGSYHQRDINPESVDFGCDVPKMGGPRALGQRPPFRGARGTFAPGGMVGKSLMEGYKSFEDEDKPTTNPVADIMQNPLPAVDAEPQMFGNSSEEVDMTQVSIPAELAGSIIGRGGMRIRQIRLDSGAFIDIDEPLPSSTDRIITIRGNNKQIQHAQYLLQMSVKKYSGKY